MPPPRRLPRWMTPMWRDRLPACPGSSPAVPGTPVGGQPRPQVGRSRRGDCATGRLLARSESEVPTRMDTNVMAVGAAYAPGTLTRDRDAVPARAVRTTTAPVFRFAVQWTEPWSRTTAGEPVVERSEERRVWKECSHRR